MATRKESVEYVNLEKPDLLTLNAGSTATDFAESIKKAGELASLQKEKQDIVAHAILVTKALALEIKKFDKYFMKDIIEKKRKIPEKPEEEIDHETAMRNLQKNIDALKVQIGV